MGFTSFLMIYSQFGLDMDRVVWVRPILSRYVCDMFGTLFWTLCALAFYFLFSHVESS